MKLFSLSAWRQIQYPRKKSLSNPPYFDMFPTHTSTCYIFTFLGVKVTFNILNIDIAESLSSENWQSLALMAQIQPS